MNYKTSEARRKASQKYRRENKETERAKTYRRTAKMYLKNHASLEDCMNLHTLALYAFEKQLTDIPKAYQKDYLKLMKNQLEQQLEDLKRMEEQL